MTAGSVAISGILLAREPSGERFVKLTLLSPADGLVCCLLRVSKKSAMSVPDIFDEAEITLDAPNGAGPRFAGDYRVITRAPAGLAGDYARFANACRFALVPAKNPPPDDTAGEIFLLLRDALSAFAARPRPDCALLKSLWKVAKIEGWPVREHWLNGLAAGDAREAVSILTEPLDAQTVPEKTVLRLTRALEAWLAGECHFVMPE